MQHLDYIQKANRIISDKKLIKSIENSINEIIVTINNRLEFNNPNSERACDNEKQLFLFHSALLNFNSATEESFRRILEQDGVKADNKAYGTMSYLIKKKYKIGTEPFDCLRALRNKVCHVVNPEGVIKTFLYTNKISSLESFMKDFISASAKFIDLQRKKIEEKETLEFEKEYSNNVAENNIYKLKL